MSAAAPDAAASVGARVIRRWQLIDPLRPLPGPASPHCGVPLTVSGRDGTAAVGRCEHWAGAPGSLDLSWGAARRFQLSAAVAGPDVIVTTRFASVIASTGVPVATSPRRTGAPFR